MVELEVYRDPQEAAYPDEIHPDYSIQQIADSFVTTYFKSGVNHRLRKTQ